MTDDRFDFGGEAPTADPASPEELEPDVLALRDLVRSSFATANGDDEPGPAVPIAPRTALEDLVETFGRWLHLPDPGALLAALGTVAANRLEGDPIWLLLVGPPGGGKSELLSAVTQLPDAHPCAVLTEAALLSGTPKKEHATDAKGGLLRKIGDSGMIVCKDFGSVLSMNRDARALVLAALREVYDGSWTRHVGTDGGRTLHWSGKVGLLGGCTPTIDRAHGLMASMGERFLLYRLPHVDARTQARRAFEHAGHEKTMRAELAAAVAALFEHGLAEPRPVAEAEIDRLVTLSTLVVRCRSAIERDGYSREIELVPEPEAPTRLIVVLTRLLAGLDALGVPRDTAWTVVTKAALDSIPALRFAVLEELRAAGLPTETGTLGAALGYPTVTVRRTLDDLTAHDLVEREPQGQGKADRWSLSPFARDGLSAAGDLSRNVVVHARGRDKEPSEPLSAPSDISGTVDEAEVERWAELGRADEASP